MLKHKIAGGLLAAALTLGTAGAVIAPRQCRGNRRIRHGILRYRVE